MSLHKHQTNKQRLHAWQQQFQHVVLSGGAPDGLVLREGGIPAARQLAIYQNAYALRLTEALRSNYSMLHQLLGDDDFDGMARDYIKAFPPAAPSIRWFGDQLSAYLAANAPFDQVPAIAELAQFEWALRHAIDAADAARASASSLLTLPPQSWGELTYDLHPSLTVLTLQWNTPQIWQALTDEIDPPAPQLSPRHWLVYRRRDLATHWRSADDREVAALAIWRDGGKFDDVCACLFDHTANHATAEESGEDVALLAATLLKTWLEQGVLIIRAQ